MRSLYIVALLISVVASPAFAQSVRPAKAQRIPQATSHDLYVGQKRHGTDPDPNVQFEKMRQRNWRKGG